MAGKSIGGYIVTRFAPSPSGHLHVGGARTALFCWAFAKTQEDEEGRRGRFMIRIEDTDRARSSDESARGILEDLAWLGIDWDDGPVLAVDRPVGGAGDRETQRVVIGGDLRKAAPYFQAQRVETYNQELEKMVRLGRAYPAFESAEELEAKRKAATAAKQTYRYERPADVQFGVFNEARWKRALACEPHVVRFAAPNEEIVVHDQVLGDVRYAPGEMDDFVIRKQDGFPTYHFAVVVDDEFMGVTHVLRAQEHLANTPRHVAMQRAMGYRTPVYGHMPLICNMDGSKMSKRDKAKAARAAIQKRIQDNRWAVDQMAEFLSVGGSDLAAFLAKESDSLEIAKQAEVHMLVNLPEIEVVDFREAGYVPEALTNFLALLGWNPGMKTAEGKDLEKFDLGFIAQNFSVERIGKGSAKFDRKKLLSFNGDYIGAMSDEEFADRWERWLLHEQPSILRGTPDSVAVALSDARRRVWLARAVKARAKTFKDAVIASAFLVRTDEASFRDPAIVERHLLSAGGSGLALLREVREKLAGLKEWEPGTVNAVLEAFASEKGLPNLGAVAQPLRVALTGSAVSPPLGETLAILGRESSLKRIDLCLKDVG